MPSLKVPFGMLGEKLVSPAEVERGLNCGCTCPGCGARLVANHPKSENRRKYFSHHANSGCSTGYESALHRAAKRVLQDARRVLVPSIAATINLYDKETQADATVTKYIGEREILLESVEQEVREYSGFVPDIVAIVGGKPLLIEIAVTHLVDDEKLEKLKRLGYPVMEIYLEPENEVPSLEEIEKLVISTAHNRSWLVNPKRDHLNEVAKIEAEEKLEAAKWRVLEQRRKAKDAHDRYLRLTDSQKLATELEMADLTIDQVRSITGRRVKGDNSFGVSSRVWQLFVYREFVHEKQGGYFHADDVLEALSERFEVREVFKDSPQIAIHYYMKFFGDIGMVERTYAKNYSVIKDVTGREFPY